MSLDNILIVEVLNPEASNKVLSTKFLQALKAVRDKDGDILEGAFWLVDDMIASWVRQGIVDKDLGEALKPSLSALVTISQELEYYACLDPMTRIQLLKQHADRAEISVEEK